MRPTVLVLSAALLAASAGLVAQTASYSSSLVAAEPGSGGASGQAAPAVDSSPGASNRFSQVAFGGGVSPLGIQLQVATNVNSHFNLRGTGNFFNYSTSFTNSGITASAKLSLDSAGVAVDIYPIPPLGFRISPGLLFYNGNQLTASASVPAGTTFTLNGTTYLSSCNPSNPNLYVNCAAGATPVGGSATLGLNTTKPAFTITTGWGNMTPRKGHWSFPFEIGVAVIGAPSVNVTLGGTACYNQSGVYYCDSITDTTPGSVGSQVQSNLNTQVT